MRTLLIIFGLFLAANALAQDACVRQDCAKPKVWNDRKCHCECPKSSKCFPAGAVFNEDTCSVFVKEKQKNIVIIQADDIGFNDYSFRGSTEIPTPNIDALAYNGIIMDRYYTAPLCTPSRGSLMTGKYPHHIGLQHNVQWNDEPWGLGLDQKLFPQYFKEAGYETHLIGKWHLGLHKEAYTPTQRGFDTHFGFLGPWTDYFDYTFIMFDRNYSRGLDLHDNLEIPKKNFTGVYATDLYTRKAIELIERQSKDQPFYLQLNQLACHAANDDFPLQAKPEDIARFPHITDPKRKTYAAMLYALDQSVGKVVEALAKNNLLEDTIIAFYSDNGGPTAIAITHPTTANNFPLRSQKGLAWEGGIRINGIIYAPFLPHGVTRNRIFHVSDILPTLATLADSKVNIDREIDGVDYSAMILGDEEPFRDEIIIIDEIYGISSLIHGGYKLVNGTFVPLQGKTDGWFGTNSTANPMTLDEYIEAVQTSPVAVNLKKYNKALFKTTINTIRDQSRVKCAGVKTACNLMVAPCLYDIDNDPCEENNLAASQPDKLAELLKRFNEHLATSSPIRYRPPDARCDPAHFNYTWTWWAQNIPEYT